MQDYNSPNELIQQVGKVLTEPLPMQPNDLYAYLANLDMLRMRVSRQRTTLQQTLYEARQRVLYPKAKEVTELDRKTMLDASTALIQADADFMVACEFILKDRVRLGLLWLERVS